MEMIMPRKSSKKGLNRFESYRKKKNSPVLGKKNDAKRSDKKTSQSRSFAQTARRTSEFVEPLPPKTRRSSSSENRNVSNPFERKQRSHSKNISQKTTRKPFSRSLSSKSIAKRRRTMPELRLENGSVFANSTEFAHISSLRGNQVSQTNSLIHGHRLQKVLAAAGYGSRRQCEELITTGRVEIDGKTVTELGVRVFPQQQTIRVDGETLPKMKPVYLAFNKPKGILCTNRDQQGRRRVIDLIPSEFGRLFSVGRLDQNSEGLLLMTNDGALAERLTHPRFEVSKKYKVQVAGLIEYEVVQSLKKGVYIAEGLVQADDVVIKSRYKQSSILEIVLKEGKNREIRRMLARLGHKVLQLQRIAVGPIKLGKMLPGEFRRLSNYEVAQLYNAAQILPDSNK